MKWQSISHSEFRRANPGLSDTALATAWAVRSAPPEPPKPTSFGEAVEHVRGISGFRQRSIYDFARRMGMIGMGALMGFTADEVVSSMLRGRRRDTLDGLETRSERHDPSSFRAKTGRGGRRQRRRRPRSRA